MSKIRTAVGQVVQGSAPKSEVVPSRKRRLFGSSSLRTRLTAGAVLLAAGLTTVMMAGQPAQALQPGEQPRLSAVGPISPQTNFPIYYQDQQGLSLELCTANNDVIGGCLFSPIDPTAPNAAYQQQIGFADEAFWYNLTGNLTIAP